MDWIKKLEVISQESERYASLSKLNEENNLFQNISVSNESVINVIKNVAIKLLDTVANSYDIMINGLTATRIQAENRLTYAKNALERLKDLPDVSTRKKIELNSGKFLTLTGDTPLDNEIIEGLKNLRIIFEKEAVENTELSLTINRQASSKLSKLLSGFEKMDLDTVTRLTQLVAEDYNVLRKKMLNTPYLKNGDDVNTLVTKPLLGAMKIKYTYEPLDEADLRSTAYTLTSALDKIASIRCNVKIDHNSLKGTYEVLPVSKGKQKTMLELAINVLQQLIEFHVRFFSKIQAVRQEIKSYRNKFNTLSKDNQNDQAKIYLRRISRLLHAVNRWLYSPAMPLLGHNLKVANAAIEYCIKSQRQIYLESQEK